MHFEKLLLPLRRWHTRIQQRSAVAELNNHTLEDLGLNRLELDAAFDGCAVAPVRHDTD